MHLRATRRGINAIVLGMALLLFGCGDDDPRPKEPADPPSPAAREHLEKWLQPNSKLTAAQWMTSRSSREPKALGDPDVKRVAATLEQANKLYRESERMIANRAVQLEEMLQSIGVNETAADILDDLTRIAGEEGQTEGFGAISQHYYNLRSNNVARGEALATLKSRYGRRS